MTAAWRSIKTFRPSAHRRCRRRPAAAGPLRFRPSFDLVEDRTLLSTFLVTSTADSGPGSLRQAILDSNAATGQTNSIDFAIPSAGVQTIVPSTTLPPTTTSVLIDGTTQPGFVGTPLVRIGSTSAASPGPLAISGGSVTVRGLAVDGIVIDATDSERLVADLHAQGQTSRLSLLDSQGNRLVTSDGAASGSPDAVIDQHLAVGTYVLGTQTAATAVDSVLRAILTPASAPFQAINAGSLNGGYDFLITGDFNGDGIPDLATLDGVYLGVGDGTFRDPAFGLRLPTQYGFIGMVSGDFNGDGKLDLAVENGFGSGGSVAILLGNGDGSFQAPTFYEVGTGSTNGLGSPTPGNLVAGDFGNGHIGLAVANYNDNSVSVLLGNGDGTFQPQVTYAAGSGPVAIAAGDFTGNGRLDLAVADIGDLQYGGQDPGGVSVLLGNGDGTFQPAREYAAGTTPVALVAGAFNGDGHLDLAVADNGAGTDTGGVSVLLSNGDGTFQPPVTSLGVIHPIAIVAGDFNGDGKVDLATTSSIGFYGISLLLGNGNGTFQAPHVIPDRALGPYTLVAGDFNDDGRLDLATIDQLTPSSPITVLLGNGDGSFAQEQGTELGSSPLASVSGDFNGDGRLDVVTVSLGGYITVLLGNGDGTFQTSETIAAPNSGFSFPSMAAADFNGDGRLDLAVAEASGVRILLGNGDGTFQTAVNYVVGAFPRSIVSCDFGNGHLDLAVANENDNTVSVLLGNGDGTFQAQVAYAVGKSPDAIVAGDFNRDGHLDLAVANENDATVTVLLGNGDGTFQPAKTVAADISGPLVAGDFNGDGRLDLGGLDYNTETNSYDLSVWLGDGDGTFEPAQTVAVGVAHFIGGNLLVGDFNGDGRPDLGGLDYNTETNSYDLSVWLSNGDSKFRPSMNVALSDSPVRPFLVAGDFNGDGKLDIALTNARRHEVDVFLGNGDGTFSDASQFATTPHSPPLLADVNGDGTRDALVIDSAGNILYRQGVPGQSGSFEPPVTINLGNPSRDIAWVPETDQGPVLASVDAHDNALSCFAWRGDRFVTLGALSTGRLPAQIIAADLNGTGWTDLVVSNAADGTLSVFFNNQLGSLQAGSLPFRWPVTLPVGVGVSDVRAVDTSGNGRLDLVVTNKLTGQVSVLQNLGNGTFGPPVPYRAGTGLSEIDSSTSLEVTSLEASAGVAAGALTPGGPTSLVTADPGSNTLGVLAGLGSGSFANAVALQTPHPAQVIRLADLNHDGITDLALLGPSGVTVMLGDGKGGFKTPVNYNVGAEPTGLTITDINGDGIPDLLVGNVYGDLLVLLGNGDGTFRPYRKADQSVALAVADLTGDGSKDVIFADHGLDRVVVDYGAGGTTVLGDTRRGCSTPPRSSWPI
jgi:hypothetical protein